jgi:hypothetical protein
VVIVVDGLGHVRNPDTRHPLGKMLLEFIEEVGRLEGVIAADRDQRVDFQIV